MTPAGAYTSPYVQNKWDDNTHNTEKTTKEVRKSTGHILGPICYSNQLGSLDQQISCQVQPTENIGNLSASRRLSSSANCSFYCLECCQFQDLSYNLQRRLSQVSMLGRFRFLQFGSINVWGPVANRWEMNIFPGPVCALAFGLARQVRLSRPAPTPPILHTQAQP